VKKAILLTSGLVVLLGGCGYFSFLAQINNSILLEYYSHQLTVTYSQDGSLPMSLDEKDYWGRPVAYFKNGRHFVLASFGADGKPDVADYEQLITAAIPRAPKSNCLLPWRDTVFIDSAVWEACLK
jgi:hypothetical protein